jgi:hypothetical protein
MAKSSRQSMLLALAIVAGLAQPALSQGDGSTAPAGQHPKNLSGQSSALPPSGQQLTPAAIGTAPTLGQVLDQEAQQQSQVPGINQGPAQGYNPGYTQGVPPGYGQNAPSVPGPGSVSAPGSVPGGYAPQSYPPGQARPGIGNLINDIRGMVHNMVQVEPGAENVKVRVPFVNVDVNHGQPNVKVNAPFVKVNKTGDAPVSVNAPFVNLAPPAQPTTP